MNFRTLYTSPSSWPFMTMAGGALALLTASFPSLAEALQYTHSAYEGFQVWRIFTGHFTHWTASHLLWDLLTFAVLGWVAETHAPERSRWMVLTAAGAISAAVWCLEPWMETYRGLSGLDSALFLFLCVSLARERRRPVLALPALLFLLKYIYETATGKTLFVEPSREFVPVPVAHLAGALVGGVFGFAGTKEVRQKAAERPKAPRFQPFTRMG